MSFSLHLDFYVSLADDPWAAIGNLDRSVVDCVIREEKKDVIQEIVRGFVVSVTIAGFVFSNFCKVGII